MILSIILYTLLILFILIILAISISYNYYIKTSYKDTLEVYTVIYTFLFEISFIKNKEKEEGYFKIFGFKKKFSSNSQKKVEDFVEKKIKDKVEEKTKENIKEKEDKKDKDKKKFSFTFIKSLITKENIKHIFDFLKDIVYMIKPDKFKTDLSIGFDDPYNNGILAAYYYTLKSMYPKIPINIIISWEEEKYSFENITKGNIRPISILIRIITFVFSTPVIKTGIKIFKYKRS